MRSCCVTTKTSPDSCINFHFSHTSVNWQQEWQHCLRDATSLGWKLERTYIQTFEVLQISLDELCIILLGHMHPTPFFPTRCQGQPGHAKLAGPNSLELRVPDSQTLKTNFLSTPQRGVSHDLRIVDDQQEPNGVGWPMEIMREYFVVCQYNNKFDVSPNGFVRNVTFLTKIMQSPSIRVWSPNIYHFLSAMCRSWMFKVVYVLWPFFLLSCVFSQCPHHHWRPFPMSVSHDAEYFFLQACE